MQTPLEIAFHNLQPSESLEADIRKRVAKLEKLYDRLVGCRVSIEALHKQHRTGNIYEVHIVLMVPGYDLAVSREPHKAKERYANPNVRTSVRDAFQAAERQLKAFKAKQRGETKPHDTLFQGQVAQLYPDKDHGFILTHTGTQLYFHRNSVMDNGFDQLRRGDPVHFVEKVGDTGPIASKVWRGPEHYLD
jgi:cold shock CspA family protein